MDAIKALPDTAWRAIHKTALYTLPLTATVVVANTVLRPGISVGLKHTRFYLMRFKNAPQISVFSKVFIVAATIVAAHSAVVYGKQLCNWAWSKTFGDDSTARA